MRILPRHLRELIDVSEISDVHKTLIGTSAVAANIAFLDVLKHWPLYGATFFEVTVSTSSELLIIIFWNFHIQITSLEILYLGIYCGKK